MKGCVPTTNDGRWTNRVRTAVICWHLILIKQAIRDGQNGREDIEIRDGFQSSFPGKVWRALKMKFCGL